MKRPVNTPKTILLGLLFAAAFLALGFLASSHRPVVPPPVRSDQIIATDPALMSQIARAQAAVALSQTAGAVSRLPFGL